MSTREDVSPPRKALVTGATGFVGAAVARKLLDEGVQVRALVRKGSDRGNLAGLDIEVVEGDLRQQETLEVACQGCDALFHVAADYRMWVPKPAEIYASNVEGTRGVLLAARSAGIRRAVYTSSVGVLGIPEDGTPGDETTPVSLDDMIGHYKRSKFQAEEVARQINAEGELEVVIVNPSTPIGPRDIKPTPTGRMVVDAGKGAMPAFVDTGLNVVHVDDVAEGHWLAWRHGRAGRRYVLGGTDMSLRQILEQVSEMVGRKPPTVEIPHAAALAIAKAAQAVARLTGKPPVATVDEVQMSRKKMYFSSARAGAELGYAPRPAQAALRDAVEWFRAQGYLN